MGEKPKKWKYGGLFMKILIVSSFAYPHLGGVSRHIEMLQKGLSESGEDAEVIGINNTGIYKAYFLPFFALEKISKKDAGTYVVDSKIKALCGKLASKPSMLASADIVHAHDAIAFAAAKKALAKAGLKKPVVLTVHGFLANEMASKYNFGKRERESVEKLEETAYRDADYVVAVEKNRLKKVMGFRKGDAEVMHNWIDSGRFRPPEEQDKEKITVLVPRRLVKKNGVKFAVEAFEGLPEEFELIISGDGPEKQNLENEVRQRGLEKRVQISGNVSEEEILEIYRNSDVVIIPSINYGGDIEGLSMSILEALSCAKPVIATEVGGNPEIIKTSFNGILVPEQDAKAIHDALLKLKDKGLREELGKNARKNIEENYSMGAGISKIKKVYREVLKK